MKSGSHSRETRSETLFRHARAMLHETRTSMEAFAQRVVEAYHSTVPPDAREVDFKAAGDLFRCAATNAQKLKRYMDADVNARIPVDLEESWVAGLTEPYRSRCREDLLGRHGALVVDDPGAAVIDDPKAIATLLDEAGRSVQAVAPMVADGRIGPEDRPHADKAVRELLALARISLGLVKRIQAVTQGR